jgi:hypothetical protein
MSSMLSRMVFDGRQLQHRRSTATHHRLVVGVVEWRVDLVVCVSDLHVRSSTWALREKLLSREIHVDKNGLTDLVTSVRFEQVIRQISKTNDLQVKTYATSTSGCQK